MILLGLLVLPSNAVAALSWDSAQVSYSVATTQREAVRQAVRWINDLPGPLRLVAARGDADIVIGDVAYDRGWSGLTLVTYGAGGRLAGAEVRLSLPALESASKTLRSEVVAHELLHAVGLPHLSGCTLMSPFGLDRGSCATDQQTRCGPQPRDLRAVQARYGGRRRGFGGYRCQ